jgi:phthalate 4,5-cis-dihydrodiol dehydrogenase
MQIKIAMVGLGQGAAGTLPSLALMPELELVAGADISDEMRSNFTQRYPGTRSYAGVDELCLDRSIDAVWIATPNRFHCEHAIAAMRAGKHVIVEKPMAVSLEEADRMVAVADKEGVILLAGHTRSLSIWNRAMRRVVLSGAIGPLRAIHVSAYTDWMLRPRTPDELDPGQGGGIVYRQGPHQVDTVRVLGGGMVRSVRGTTGKWFDARPVPGYYTAYMEFEDGTAATIMHNGYGYYMTSSQYPWVTEKRSYTDADRATLRRSLIEGSRDEVREKVDYRVGGPRDPQATATPVPYPWKPFDLGPVDLVCERGIIRPEQWGLSVYGDDGRRDIDLRELQRAEPDPSGGLTHAIIGELYDALAYGKPAFHTGAWGRATLEAVLAIICSAEERREIRLERQVPMPDSYDDVLGAAIEDRLHSGATSS